MRKILDGTTTCPKNLDGYKLIVIDGGSNQASYEKVAELHRRIESRMGFVIKVTLIENVHVAIYAYCAAEQVDSIIDNEWRIIRIDEGQSKTLFIED